MKNELNVLKSLRLGALAIALALAGTALTGTALTGTGFAQAKDVDPGENCYCIVPAGSTGQVLSSSGDVQVSGTHGFTPAAPGTALSPGSLIFVGQHSDAHIVFGGCQLNLLSLRDVSLNPVDGGICVRTTPADGRSAGFDPAVTSTLSTLGATFPQAVSTAAPAAGTSATAGAAGGTAAAGAGAAAGAAAATGAAAGAAIPAVAIAAVGAVAVGGFVAIAVSQSDPVSP